MEDLNNNNNINNNNQKKKTKKKKKKKKKHDDNDKIGHDKLRNFEKKKRDTTGCVLSSSSKGTLRFKRKIKKEKLKKEKREQVVLNPDAKEYIPSISSNVNSYANIIKRKENVLLSPSKTNVVETANEGFHLLTLKTRRKTSGISFDKYLKLDETNFIDNYLDGILENAMNQVYKMKSEQRINRLCARWREYCEETEEDNTLVFVDEKEQPKKSTIEKESQQQQQQQQQPVIIEKPQKQQIALSTPLPEQEFLKRELLEVCKMNDPKILLQWGNEQIGNGKTLSIVNSFSNDKSPLEYSIEHGYIEIINILLDWGANADHKHYRQRNNDKQSALHHCCCIGNPNIVKLLLERNHFNMYNGINVKDAKGRTPLHCCIQYFNYDMENDYVNCIKLLLEGGAHVRVKDKSGNSPLHYTASFRTTRLIDILLNHGDATLEVKNQHGETALHLAALHGAVEVIAQLIRYGADLDAQTTQTDHLTPVCYAIKGKQLEAMELLIDRGANIDSESCPNALHYACSIGFNDGIDYFLLKSNYKTIVETKNNVWPNDTLIITSLRNGQWDCATHLIKQYQVDLNETNRQGYTPLLVALLNSSKIGNYGKMLEQKLLAQLVDGCLGWNENTFIELPSNRELDPLSITVEILKQQQHDPIIEKHIFENVLLYLIEKGARITPRFLEVIKQYIDSTFVIRNHNKKKRSGRKFTDYLTQMKYLRNYDESFDVKIKLEGGSSMLAHKVVLGAHCPYFKGMFNFGEERKGVIDLSHHPKEIVEDFISYLYTNEHKKVKSIQDCLKFLSQQKLGVNKIKQKKLLQSLIDLLLLANEFLVPKLEELCSQSIALLCNKTEFLKADVAEFALEMNLEYLKNYLIQDQLLPSPETNDVSTVINHPLLCNCPAKLLKELNNPLFLEFNICEICKDISVDDFFVKMNHLERVQLFERYLPHNTDENVKILEYYLTQAVVDGTNQLQSWQLELGDMLNENVCTDVEIIISEFKTIHAHKTILSYRSGWFREKIIKNNHKVIDCQSFGFEENIWDMVIYFLYTGLIRGYQNDLKISTLTSLISLGDILGVSNEFVTWVEKSMSSLLLLTTKTNQQEEIAPLIDNENLIDTLEDGFPDCLWKVEQILRKHIINSTCLGKKETRKLAIQKYKSKIESFKIKHHLKKVDDQNIILFLGLLKLI